MDVKGLRTCSFLRRIMNGTIITTYRQMPDELKKGQGLRRTRRCDCRIASILGSLVPRWDDVAQWMVQHRHAWRNS